MIRQLFTPTVFLALTIGFTSCNGQIKTDLPKDKVSEPITNRQPKLIRTQGTNEYINVRCGLQDRRGNLWFGTTGEGVYRFDGKLFTQFTIKDGLSNNIVYSIEEDNAGNIWFGTDNGISFYDGKAITVIPISVTGAFFNINSKQNPISSTKNEVWSIMQDKSGLLWFGTREDLYTYDGKSFSRFLDNPNIANKDSLHLRMINCMLEDKNGHIWFGSGMPPGGEGICRSDGKSITSFKPNGDGWIRYMVEDKNGAIWFGTRHQDNWRFDGKTFSRYTEKVGVGAPALVDRSGNIWFTGEEHKSGYAGNGGVWRYDGNSFKNFTSKDGMGNFGVWSIVEDREGNIWFGTRNNGLYRYDGKSFNNFSE